MMQDMMLVLSLLARGILLGLSAAAPIGPVNVEIARRTLRHGFLSGFFTGLGAVTVDVFYMVLVGIGVRLLIQHTAFYWALVMAGVVFLIYLGAASLRSAIRGFRSGAEGQWEQFTQQDTRASAHNAYLTGLFMTLFNPMTLAFWFVAVPAAVGPIASQPQRELPMMGLGVFLGTVIWVLFFAGSLSMAVRCSTHRGRWLPLADLIGGATLIVFAAMALWNSIRPLL